jgi:hypothetical protein
MGGSYVSRCFAGLAIVASLVASKALADEDAVLRYQDYLPSEILALSDDERRSFVPMIFSGAAQLATSAFGEVVLQMQLNTLMYNGLSDFEGAVRAYQADLGEEVTGDLTVGQINELGYRADRTRLGYVGFFSLDHGGFMFNDFAQVSGTAVILGDQIAYPVNHVTVECRRSNMTCRYRQIILSIPDENSWVQNYSVSELVDETYRITRWEDEQIDATPFNASSCRINQLSFNFRTNEYYEIARNNSEGACEIMEGMASLPRLEQPRVTQIVDGSDVINETFQEIAEEVRGYYASAFQERLNAAVSEYESTLEE